MPPVIDIDAIIAEARTRFEGDLALMFTEHAKAVASDAADFLAANKARMQTFITQFTSGEISELEFESQVRSLVGLAKMHALTELVLAKARKDEIMKKISDILLELILKLLRSKV